MSWTEGYGDHPDAEALAYDEWCAAQAEAAGRAAEQAAAEEAHYEAQAAALEEQWERDHERYPW